MPKDLQYYAISADQGRIFRKVLEGTAGLVALLIGLQMILLIPAKDIQVFVPMLLFAPLPVWGIGMVVLSVVRISILVVNGWWPWSALVRKYMSILFMVFVWFPLVASYVWSMWESLVVHQDRILPGIAFAAYCASVEFLIFFAHSSFVIIERAHGDKCD